MVKNTRKHGVQINTFQSGNGHRAEGANEVGGFLPAGIPQEFSENAVFIWQPNHVIQPRNWYNRAERKSLPCEIQFR